MTAAVLSAHAAATVMMAGVIWFVQLVHYPLMAAVGRRGFAAYERMHMRRTTWIVAPLMLTEAVSALLLPALVTATGAVVLAWVGLALLALIWASTALLQVPCHRRLGAGPDRHVLRRLVATNWLRTGAWSVRAAVALALLARPLTSTLAE